MDSRELATTCLPGIVDYVASHASGCLKSEELGAPSLRAVVRTGLD